MENVESEEEKFMTQSSTQFFEKVLKAQPPPLFPENYFSFNCKECKGGSYQKFQLLSQ